MPISKSSQRYCHYYIIILHVRQSSFLHLSFYKNVSSSIPILTFTRLLSNSCTGSRSSLACVSKMERWRRTVLGYCQRLVSWSMRCLTCPSGDPWSQPKLLYRWWAKHPYDVTNAESVPLCDKKFYTGGCFAQFIGVWWSELSRSLLCVRVFWRYERTNEVNRKGHQTGCSGLVR